MIYQPLLSERSGRSMLQPKLKIGAPGDRYEREADAVADRVMRMRDGESLRMQPVEEEEETMQMQPLEEEEEMMQPKLQMQPEIRMQCPTCQEEKGQRIQTKESDGRMSLVIQRSGDGALYADASFSNRLQSRRGLGQSLPESVHKELGGKFGADFSEVRVHTDSHAIQMTRDIGAQAFTFGSDVYFNKDHYNPASTSGKHLLAHELTHVVQQRATQRLSQKKFPFSQPLQRQTDDASPTRVMMSPDALLPKPADEEGFVVGNTMELISGNSFAELMFPSSESLPKAPKGKGKMGGPLGPVTEGVGQSKGELSTECKEWAKLNRTTYGYDTSAGADPVEKDFLTTYKNFKEGVPVAEPGDFNKKLKAATANPCTCLEQLNIDGHGASWSGGAQEFAPRKFDLGKRSFGVKKDKDGKLVPYNFGIFDDIKFCKPCNIKLGGCYVGLNKPKDEAGPNGLTGAGDALGKALAEKTGCSVTAYTDTTTTEKAGAFEGSGSGKWVTTEPAKSEK
jgi:hypothetical protein